jgi:hypothetical protein
MTTAERAAQFWPALVLAAKTQQFLSYDALEQMTNPPRFSQSKVLGTIWTYCQQNGLPADPVLNAAVPDIEAEQRRVFVYDWLSRKCPSVEEFTAAASELKDWETANA